MFIVGRSQRLMLRLVEQRNLNVATMPVYCVAYSLSTLYNMRVVTSPSLFSLAMKANPPLVLK